MTAKQITMFDGGSDNAQGYPYLPTSQTTNANCQMAVSPDTLALSIEPSAIKRSKGFSPMSAYLKKMYTLHANANIGMNVAMRNSGIMSHQKGKPLFNRLLNYYNYFASGNTLVGLVYITGERDASIETNAGNWSELFQQFVGDFRIAVSNETLPIVFTQLPTKPTKGNYKYWTTVISGQQDAATALGATATLINTNAIPTMRDGIHFTQAGLITLGEAIAAEMDVLVNPI